MLFDNLVLNNASRAIVDRSNRWLTPDRNFVGRAFSLVVYLFYLGDQCGRQIPLKTIAHPVWKPHENLAFLVVRVFLPHGHLLF
jgi:hypothetical protein